MLYKNWVMIIFCYDNFLSVQVRLNFIIKACLFFFAFQKRFFKKLILFLFFPLLQINIFIFLPLEFFSFSLM
jgi:hypothetical protein